MTPMMQQYLDIKEQYREYLLFYRVGDFYEMFYDDAVVASRELELTLTGKDCGEEERAPMAGVPFHAVDVYIGKAIDKGFKIAICDQVEDPATAQGIVRREVTRVVTPGTLIETNLLSEQKNNYLCTIYFGEYEYGVCFSDISTAEIFATSFDGASARERLINEIGTYCPAEIVTNLSVSKFSDIAEVIKSRVDPLITDNQPGRFEYGECRDRVKKQFCEGVPSDALANKAIVCAVGAMLDYIAVTQKKDISYIKRLNLYTDGQYLELDINTRRNLELVETMRSKEKRGTLLWVLDKTRSAMGARLLRKWVEHPLLSPSEITRRQAAVEELYGSFMTRESLSELLDSVLDLERLITKVVYGSANAKDLKAIENTLAILPELSELLSGMKSDTLREIYGELDTLSDIYDLIHRAIDDDPAFSVREGGMIRLGYNEQVDELRGVVVNGDTLREMLADRERQQTGIRNLKVGYNKVFGYYIEVTRSQFELVPDHYVRKQTLANAERYITQELKELEGRILGASDRLCAIEYDLFCEVRNYVSERSERIQKVAALLAEIDAYYSLATVASKNRYVKPEILSSDKIEIKDGRHPVVEQFVKDSYFVPNDTHLDTSSERLMLITGPNMAGKSTYMRQVALIVLMAQMGSFVPANEASIGIVDKIFTRVGASDDLASGQSTFMLEMTEVAYILKNATRKSLIIYDEVGRGTSTFDGMSIARAIVEYTAGKKIGAKTLFATHYHELTSMEGEYEGIVNYNIAAKKRGDNITFLRKIVRGSTDDSYGIEVAKLAGVPNEVIKRAREVLETVVESAQHLSLSGSSEKVERKADEGLLSLTDVTNEQVIEELRRVDINTLSPYECMTLLFDLKKRLI